MIKRAGWAPSWNALPGLPATALKAIIALLASSALGGIVIALHGITGTGATTREFPPFINMWIRWDAGWYQGIAENGYSFSTTVQSAAAYFPLYPSVIHMFVRAGANPFIAGILLTAAFGLAAFCLFWLWAKQLSDPLTADLATQIFLVWPFAFYLYGAVYSDALFIALSLGAFLLLERRALVPAIVLGALATAARPVGPALVLGLLIRQIELRRKEGARPGLMDFAPLLCVLGMAGYMLFLYLKFGDPLAFMKAQGAWRQDPGWSSLLKLPLFHRVLQRRAYGDLFLPALHLFMAVGFLALAAPTRKLLGWGYAVYVVAVLGIPLVVSRDFIGLGRYCLAAFPCFLTLAMRLRETVRVRKVWMVVSVLLLAVMVSEFAIGHYIS